MVIQRHVTHAYKCSSCSVFLGISLYSFYEIATIQWHELYKYLTRHTLRDVEATSYHAKSAAMLHHRATRSIFADIPTVEQKAPAQRQAHLQVLREPEVAERLDTAGDSVMCRKGNSLTFRV